MIAPSDLLRNVPAHTAEGERAVLGALFLDPAAIDLVACEVKPSDFYLTRHRLVFQTILDLHAQRKPFDKLHVLQLLRSRGQDEDAGGPVEIDALTSAVPTSANAVYYAKSVTEQARVRAAQEAVTWASRRLYERIEDADEVLESVEARVFAATQARIRDEAPTTIGTVLQDVFRAIEAAKNGERSGLATGILALDDKTNGLPRGEVTVIGARPAVGKSTFALNVTRNAVYGTTGAQANRRAVFFSLEMPAAQVAQNLLCSFARVDSHALRTGRLTREDEDRLVTAAELAAPGRLDIVEASNLTALEIRARARRLAAQGGLDLVVVDYLQLMSADRVDRRLQRHEEVAEISRGLKALAGELKVPIVALSQLNRNSEDRPDKRPRLSDLRESGAVEQDAALVILLHRDELYETNPDKRALVQNEATAIVAKNRYGPVGDVPLYYEKRFSLFLDAEAAPSPGVPHYERPRYGGEDA